MDMSYEPCDADERIATHRLQVRKTMEHIAVAILERGQLHDASKLQNPEHSIFCKFMPLLDITPYGTDEYFQILAGMKEALDHHYAVNRHHPEHFGDGINGMTLLDLIEMIVDWHISAGDAIYESIEKNCSRFLIEPQMKAVLTNTIKQLRGEDHDESSG